MKYKRANPESVVMEITPAIAEEMLATSTGNRRIRQSHVDFLAGAMKRGEWRATSQGIGFDWHGSVRDGHHRLRAIVESGVSVTLFVMLGLPPDAYEVTDIGLKRTAADLLNENKYVADIVSLGSRIALATANPTVDQMRPIIDAGLGTVAHSLIESCGTVRKYYASAPMKLAACITIMNGGDAAFVLQQYRALCLLDFDAMEKSAQALARQVNNGSTRAINTRETLARGFRVFDKGRRNVGRIQVSDADIEAAVELTRSVLRKSVTNTRFHAKGHHA